MHTLWQTMLFVLAGSLLLGCGPHEDHTHGEKGPAPAGKGAMEKQPPLETIRREHDVIRKVADAARADARAMLPPPVALTSLLTLSGLALVIRMLPPALLTPESEPPPTRSTVPIVSSPDGVRAFST